MSESSSALTLIADDDEFRFARFYIVYEGVQLGRLKSPPIVSGVPDMPPSDCPNVEETRNPMQTFSRLEILTFFSNEFPAVFLSEIPQCVFLIILLIPQKRSMLIAAAPSGSFLTVRRSATPPLLFRTLRSASVLGTATGRPLFLTFPRSVL